jgi:hypothetical protein
MKRFLLAATFLAASQILLPATESFAQSNDPPAPAQAPVHRHHKHRHHVKVVAPAPTAEENAPSVTAAYEPPAVVAPNAAASAVHAAISAPAPAPRELAPIRAMARVASSQPATTAGSAGEGLTPTGAIRAGNAEGTIPAWTGGLVGIISSRPVHTRPDPFPGEKPLFSINAQNVDRYADKLAAGTAAMIRTLPGYRVDVYPTHRTFAAPQFIYDNAVANMTRAHLVHGGQGVEGAELSIPFPVPHNGYEAVWNHILRWRGTQILRSATNVISTPSGDYSLQRWHEDIMLPYNTPGFANPRQWDSMFRQEVLSPPRDAGALTLAISHQNPYDQAREAWTYNPGERRVRRAPDIDYDTPLQDTDGLETVDDYDLFNGALDRFDWTLVGRKEVYVPYNSNRLEDPALRYTDLIGRQALNPTYIRFELHRVWVVEAKLKAEYRHIYTRRTLYLDEDSWQALISDRYDGRGNLWRTALAFTMAAPEVPAMIGGSYEFVDLYQHRYLAQGLYNQESFAPSYNAVSLTPRDFTAESLRRMGLR